MPYAVAYFQRSTLPHHTLELCISDSYEGELKDILDKLVYNYLISHNNPYDTHLDRCITTLLRGGVIHVRKKNYTTYYLCIHYNVGDILGPNGFRELDARGIEFCRYEKDYIEEIIDTAIAGCNMKKASRP